MLNNSFVPFVTVSSQTVLSAAIIKDRRQITCICCKANSIHHYVFSLYFTDHDSTRVIHCFMFQLSIMTQGSKNNVS